MKRTIVLVSFFLACVLVPGLRAQDHVEVGVFGDYFRFQASHSNFLGLGARVGAGSRILHLEAEMNYDFAQAFTEGFRNTDTGSVTFVSSNLRVLHGMFGPKLQTRGRVKVFVTAKGGFINFRFDPRSPSFDTFTSSVGDLRTDNVNATFYPAVGVETFLGPFGLRLEAGDEMYFIHSAHHNVRITFGPQIRF
jgi:hypothetical protein